MYENTKIKAVITATKQKVRIQYVMRMAKAFFKIISILINKCL